MKLAPLAIWLWYRGGSFNGFQRQKDGGAVQDVVRSALSALGVGASAQPAGRTDKGVHARMQVVSVRSSAKVVEDELVAAIDRARPGELGAILCRRAHPSFHAQWRAAGKEYRYRLALGGALPERWRGFAWDVRGHPRLADRPMPTAQRVLELLHLAVGPRDFWAFHEKSSPRRLRTLKGVQLHPAGDGVMELRLTGNSFGRYQVRYLVGSAVAAACGALEEARFRAALDSAEEIDGVKAPAEGLTLWSVAYPEGLDPFSPQERLQAPGLPGAPPF